MTRTVRVEADLTAAVGGDEVTVRGYGDRVVLDFPTLAALRRAGDAVDALPRPLGLDVAARGDIAVDVRLRGTSVARLGPDTRAGPLSRLAGVAPARLSIFGLLRALVR